MKPETPQPKYFEVIGGNSARTKKSEKAGETKGRQSGAISFISEFKSEKTQANFPRGFPKAAAPRTLWRVHGKAKRHKAAKNEHMWLLVAVVLAPHKILKDSAIP